MRGGLATGGVWRCALLASGGGLALGRGLVMCGGLATCEGLTMCRGVSMGEVGNVRYLQWAGVGDVREVGNVGWGGDVRY